MLRSSEALEGNDSARRTRHPLSLLRRGQPQLSGLVRVVDLSSSALRGSGCAELVDGPSHASPPWKHRPHGFWALPTWEKNLNSFVRPRIFAAVQEL